MSLRSFCLLGLCLRTVVNIRSLGKLVSSVLLKFLNLTNFFTPPKKSIHTIPLPLAGIKNNTRDFLGICVCGGCADDREIATACGQASQ